MTHHPRILVLTAGGPHPAIIANALCDAFGSIDYVYETPEPRGAFLRRRARLIGWFATAGQFATMILVVLLKRLLAGRIRERLAALGLETGPRAAFRTHTVSSANGQDFVDLARRLAPDVIFLVGCRVMKASVIAQAPAPILNYHAGVTPLYRGMNGGYWALAQDDPANFGATVHLVDAGIDTGDVIDQIRVKPMRGDWIGTYACTLAAASRAMCVAAARAAAGGALQTTHVEGPSRQWFHPTIWGYLWTGLRKGVW